MSKRLVFLLCAALACAVLVAACGDDSDSAGGAGTEETGSTEGVKAVDPASMDGAKGEVTYCSGKDTSGDLKETIAEFNTANPDLQVKLVEFPEDAQQQHDQFVQRQKAKSGDCDAFEEDVVWTAEFASQKWLMDMSDYIETRDDFVPSTLETVTFDGKVFGAPRASDAGMMYYRTDQVKEFPATWQELYSEAAKGDGLVYQGSAYEGLTVDFLEYAFAAGGSVISEDGKKSTINSEENIGALKFMVDGIKDGAAPKAVTTMTEEPARRAWEAGKATFMRNWSYCYALSQKAPKVKGKFAVAPYPEYEGGGKAAVLGGHNMVISVYSKNPGGALKFIDYATSPERIAKNASKYSKTPTITAAFDDPAVKKAMPFAAALKEGVENAKSRPVSPVYPQISEAIFKNVNAALSGSTSPEDALKQADTDINNALATF